MNSLNSNSKGHLLALLTIVIWGTTFISTKVLLRGFAPLEILFFRFLIGFLVLLIAVPSRLVIREKQHQPLFLAAGLCGITLYYLLENIALTFSTASNVGIICTIAPFFTAILSRFFLKAEKPPIRFYLGFLTALAGIIIISYNGQKSLHLNPLGDFLALLATVTWAAYSILTKKISNLGYPTVKATRRIFLYGLMFMLPLLVLTDFQFAFERFADKTNLLNILFLGVGASALCFVTWNSAVKLLGAVKTSVYIYLVPVVTVATSAVVLKEPITPLLIAGTILILLGLWLSETKFSFIKLPFRFSAKS